MTNPHKLHGEGRDGIKRKFKSSWAIEHGIDPDRLEMALEIIEACYQNGQDMGTEPGRSIAHVAAMAPDVCLLAALYMYGAPLDQVDEDGITPAYMLALRMPTEEQPARTAAKFLKATGVSFIHPGRRGGKAPVKALEEWPSFWEQWAGWKERNESPDAKYKMSKLQLFLAFVKHRVTVKAAKRFIYDLG